MAADQWVQWESFCISRIWKERLTTVINTFLLIEQVLSKVWEYLLFFYRLRTA